MTFGPVFRTLLITLLGLIYGLSNAQNIDPPGRVARLSDMTGPVSFAPGGNETWSAASLNQPFTSGDRLWSDNGSRAELEIGNATLRLNARTSAELTALDDTRAQIKLTQGSFNLRVHNLAQGENIEVDTPNLAFVARAPGEYRLDVDPANNTTQVTLRSGSAEVFGANQVAAPLNGPVSIIYREQDLTRAAAGAAPPPDEFDRWAEARDRRIESSRSARYVAPGTVGYADLDSYGSWSNTPDYGPVWIPSSVAPDWAPYRYGRWTWVEPWGWTWVDDAPWGFAPFHYGRWARVRGAWGWVPGPTHVRPVYAPALVVFNVGINASRHDRSPGVAWFPLAPGEVFRPAYRSSPAYVSGINRTIVNNITINKNVYVNQRTAVTAVSSDNFVRGQQVGRNRMHVDASTLIHNQARPAPQLKPLEQSSRSNAGAVAPNTQHPVITTQRPMQIGTPSEARPEHRERPTPNAAPQPREANRVEQERPSHRAYIPPPAQAQPDRAAPTPRPQPQITAPQAQARPQPQHRTERVEREAVRPAWHNERDNSASRPQESAPVARPQHEQAPVRQQAPAIRNQAPAVERAAPPAPAPREHENRGNDRHEQGDHHPNKPPNKN